VPPWQELAAFHRSMTLVEFTRAWEEFYSDGGKWPLPWTTLPTELEVPRTGVPGDAQRVEFRQPEQPAAEVKRWWRRPEELPPLGDRPPLSDLHIALDPGHIGGSYSVMEERHLTFNPAAADEVVREGDSTLQVAQVLKPMLEAAGARVSLLRDSSNPVTTTRPAELRTSASVLLNQAGISSPLDTYAGLTGDQKIITVQWQTEKLFYRVSEIRARAEKVNGPLKPDLVVCLHFNAEAWGAATSPQFTSRNHFHILINGCYAPNELQLADVRYEALARLFARVHEVELPLAESVARSVADISRLPPYIYTTPNARNVGRTRSRAGARPAQGCASSFCTSCPPPRYLQRAALRATSHLG
jgi:hypothetical protein